METGFRVDVIAEAEAAATQAQSKTKVEKFSFVRSFFLSFFYLINPFCSFIFLFLPINFPSSQHCHTYRTRWVWHKRTNSHSTRYKWYRNQFERVECEYWILNTYIVFVFFFLLHNSVWLLYFYRFHMNAFRLMISNTIFSSPFTSYIHIKMPGCGNTTTHSSQTKYIQCQSGGTRMTTTSLHGIDHRL